MKKAVVAVGLALTMALSIPMAAFAGTWAAADDGTWTYDTGGGKIAKSQWIKSGKSWYYMKQDCKMASGESLNIGGYNYLFAKNGKMINGWVKSGNDWYYYHKGGTQAIGKWVKSGKVWYYMKADGKMAAGESLNIKGKNYLFAKNGKMFTGWIKSGNSWYFYKPSGAQAINGWAKDGKYWYYFKEDGKMIANQSLKINGYNYLFRKGGSMVTGWVKSGGNWYYYYPGGSQAINKWIKSGKYWYFMKADGTMAQFEWVGDYIFAEDGHWVDNMDISDYNNFKDVVRLFYDKPVLAGPFPAPEMLEDLNKLRAEVGVPPLIWDEDLANHCMIRSKEIVHKFSHDRPAGAKPYDKYKKPDRGGCGENIAADNAFFDNKFEHAAELWNTSKGHYGNRTNSRYKWYGAAYYRYGGSIFWVEYFQRPRSMDFIILT